jgi:molybdenum cofactor synthesis domain-containing protein
VSDVEHKTKMRPFRETIPLDRARALIDGAIRPIDRTENIALAYADGRVLAADVVAASDVPPFPRAAMDGYAVRATDTTGATRETPKTLTCVEKVFTGQLAAKHVGARQCIEIATGAPMPAGADAVVMVEETETAAGNKVRVFAPVKPLQNIGRQGADIQKGQTVLRAGDVLNASRVGALAALGRPLVEVYERPRVAILSTGNEIVDPGQDLEPGQIYDINRFTVSAVVAEHGGIPVPYGTVRDTVEDLSSAVERALEQDILLFSGGSSVGERDLIMDVIKERGDLLFHGVAVKPGKPLAFGTIEGKLFFGLPGYPTSCLSNTYIFVVPALRRMARLPAGNTNTVTLPLGQRIVSPVRRHQFYTVRIVNGAAIPAFKASGDITSMSQADGYIEIPIDTDVVEEGSPVTVTLF